MEFAQVTINKLKLFSFFTICFTLLVNCSNSKPIKIGFTDIDSGYNYNNSELMKMNTQRGITRLLASDQLTNYKDSLSIDLVFNVLEPSSSLTLVAYTNSMSTKTGTSVRFTVKENILEVDIFAQDYPLFHLCHLENFITSNGDVRLKIQLLNSQATGPVISIWNQSDQFSDSRKRNFNAYNINTAECSSHNIYAPINMFGLGNLWGLELNKIKLKSVVRTETYVL